jgi:hypothetical protein
MSPIGDPDDINFYEGGFTLFVQAGQNEIRENNANGSIVNLSGITWNGTMLTLSNFSFETSAAVALQMKDGGTIQLIGTNILKSTYNNNSPNSNSEAIFADTNLTIQAGGTLTVISGRANRSSGIHVNTNNLTIGGGATVEATGGTASERSLGISVPTGNITIDNDAKVKATGGTSGTSSSEGIYVGGILNIGGGAVVTATGGTASQGNSYGVFVNLISGSTGTGTMTINNDATIIARGGTANAGQSNGIAAAENLNIDGGATVNAFGGASPNSIGVWVANGLTLTSGTVTMSGETRAIFYNSDTSGNYNKLSPIRHEVSNNSTGIPIINEGINNFLITIAYKWAKLQR